MIKNISFAFILINLVSSFLYMPVSHPVSINPDEYLLLLQEPIAEDDEYETNQNVQLIVDAPGVMLNDVFEQGIPRISVLEASASHGIETLNLDGSFEYNPDIDFIGTDTFTYILEQDGVSSNVAVVQITILDTQPPSVEWVSPVLDEDVLIVGDEIVQLVAGAMDNDLVTGVQFYRWDSDLKAHVLYDILETAPYQMELLTEELNFEWNQIFVRAFDASGNVSTSPFIWLYRQPVDYLLYLPIHFR
jgi:hypothetical protein